MGSSKKVLRFCISCDINNEKTTTTKETSRKLQKAKQNKTKQNKKESQSKEIKMFFSLRASVLLALGVSFLSSALSNLSRSLPIPNKDLEV